MPGLVPYFHFAGTAREALDFYAGIFGGTVEANTFAEFGRTDGAAEFVAHGHLGGGPVELFAADAAEGEEALSTQGLMFSLLGTAAPDELTRWFEQLSVGGEVKDALALRDWGDHDGQVIDKYGVFWLIGYQG
jgi:PhnB protein